MFDLSDKRNKFNQLQRESDSFLTKRLARPVSRYITLFLESTFVTPLQVTLFGFIISLIAAYTITLSHWTYLVAAAILIELAHILDCVDGELARLTDKGSKFAANIDPITDRIKDVVILYASCIYLMNNNIFNLNTQTIYFMAYISVSLWFLYIYIVDAYTNPLKRKHTKPTPKATTYIGLYDLFIYGSILLLITNTFYLFLPYILSLSFIGIVYQISKMYRYTK